MHCTCTIILKHYVEDINKIKTEELIVVVCVYFDVKADLNKILFKSLLSCPSKIMQKLQLNIQQMKIMKYLN